MHDDHVSHDAPSLADSRERTHRIFRWASRPLAECRKRRCRRRANSGAFEEYRQQTLRRLEDEQTAFKSFLDQLRSAKDRTEFDQFMTQRKSR
jgi:hypothetical protein